MRKSVKQLNEELKQICEISDDLAQRVSDRRKQDVLDAASKYVKNQKLMDARKQAKPDVEEPEENEEKFSYEKHTKNELQNIINGTYEGDMADAVVLENLDKIDMADLVNILDDYFLYKKGIYRLFPSYWQYRHIDQVYPAKLAQAIANSNNCESLTDIYNIFYRHANKELFKNALQVWQDDILNSWGPVHSEILCNMTDGDDVSQLKDLYDQLQKNCPKFAHQFLNLLEYEEVRIFNRLMDSL